MSGPLPASLTPSPATWPMIRTLGLVAMISGFLVVLVYQVTLPRIADNKRRAIERAVFQVIPGATARKEFLLGADGLVPAADGAEGIPVYGGYGEDGRLLGIAAEAAAPGYQDVIRLLFGYSPGRQCITGIKVLRSTETPGLGDKITKDPAFLANFQCLDARLDDSGKTLRNPILTVKHGRKTRPWQIDAISGATVSSKAVGKALNNSAQALLPRLRAHLKEMGR